MNEVSFKAALIACGILAAANAFGESAGATRCSNKDLCWVMRLDFYICKVKTSLGSELALR